AALAWWFIALQKQNNEITDAKLEAVAAKQPGDPARIAAIQEAHRRKTAQYIGEGVTFLALILVGAVFVFRATRRQLRLSQQQHNFMMAVTHELKTPIAVTQLNLETLQKRKLDEGKQQKLITNTLAEANRLNTLCNNILLASQLDAGVRGQEKTEINFSDLAAGCVDDCLAHFPQRSIVEEIADGIYLVGDPLQLQMLINNLLENAIKYSPADAAVKLCLSSNHQQIRLAVHDEGEGIPDPEKKRVFEKFYRSGNENTRRSKGTGLGLYLCKRIVKNHGGQITVSDNTPRGTIFTVTFTAG
ncbi:MAG TPA: HAMP domain-containing sensor histidine kinase, partial [Sediminibacterium sp.]|nr:HAMP domain-containing sensor histidine kinase [Sediminibacterium sp.]